MHESAPTTPNDRGASLVEYALLVALIAVVCLGALNLVGRSSRERFEETAQAIATTGVPAPGSGSDGGAPAPGGSGTDVLGEVVYPPGQSPAELQAAAEAAAAQAAAEAAGQAAAQAAAEQAAAAAQAAAQAAAEQAAAEAAEGAAAAAQAAAMTNVTYGSGSSRMYWYDAHGKQGQWVATVAFSNGWERHSYLELEVVRTWGDGRTAKHTVSGFYVPAKGSANLEVFENGVKDNGNTKDDVVSVTVKVLKVTTSDLQWQPFTTSVTAAPYSVTAPAGR